MKKIIFAILLGSLIASTFACDTPTCTSGTCSSGTCSTTTTCPSPSPAPCSCNPSFPVNQPVQICTPPTVQPPPCLIPTIPQPCVCPPTVQPPTINAPCIDVPDLTPPPVIAPPCVVPPTVVIPPPVIPVPCAPTPPPIPSCPPPPPQPPVLPPPPPPGCTCDSCSSGSCSSCGCAAPQPLSNKFTLSFDYACREGVAFGSCMADVLWNNQIIFSIVPVDHIIHSYSIQLIAHAGENRLQFEGAGISDSYGLTIDNVKLIRFGTATDIVVNGGFEQPSVGFSWGIFPSIPGWSDTAIEVGWGQIYNAGWNSHVVELDSNGNFQITQSFSFDSNYFLIASASCDTTSFSGQTLAYKLQFDYAARANGVGSPLTSRADVIWNDEVVASINPNDYAVHHISLDVELRPGYNFLSFDGASYSDSYGLLIDNVVLNSLYNSSSLIVNGGFETPYVGGAGFWNYFNGGIYAWSAVKAEVGHAYTVYNSNWPAATGQCIQLDSDSNQRYTQKITISQELFTALLVQQKAYEGNMAAANHLSCEAYQAMNTVTTAIATIQGKVLCQIGLTASKFNNYLCKLYSRADAHVNDLQADEELTVSQYNCLSQAYTSAFGASTIPDFDDSAFDTCDLQDWEGWIEAINGNIITCHDGQGHYHKLHISHKCTHFEGQYPLPRLGQKIFWKGAVQPCGTTYVKYATTCNC